MVYALCYGRIVQDAAWGESNARLPYTLDAMNDACIHRIHLMRTNPRSWRALAPLVSEALGEVKKRVASCIPFLLFLHHFGQRQ